MLLDRQNCHHTYNQFVIRRHCRDALMKHLRECSVNTEIYYWQSMHLSECFCDQGWKAGDFPVRELVAHQSLALPIYPELREEQVAHVVESPVGFFRACI